MNKVNSKVTLYWDIEKSSISPYVRDRFKVTFKNMILDDGTVQIMSQKHRTQKANMDDCIEKLHDLIEEVRVPPKVRRATKPKKSAVLKRLQTKKKDGEKKRMRKADY